ncbi:hypothetical protein MCHI_002713 [Candidatus Magnetoovum chiemensis]|nr:hypothetical protein MCHI_002713 [Candidatus Magnetoovum chiemensis]
MPLSKSYITTKIKETLRSLEETHPSNDYTALMEQIERLDSQSKSAVKFYDRILWRYGTRFACIIKKMPIIKQIAQKYYIRTSDYRRK